MLRLLLDHFHDGIPVFVAILLRLPRHGHAFDEGLRHFQFLLVQFHLRPVQFFRREHFAGKMHQLQDKEQAVRLDRGEVFPIADNDFGNADLARATKRPMQKRVSLFATFLRLKKIGLVEEFGIDLL